MIARNRSRFADLNTGDMFHFVSLAVRGANTADVERGIYRKSSPRTAVRQRDGKDGQSVDDTIKVGKLLWVFIWTPDPTPEEVEQKRRERVSRRVTNQIDGMLARAQRVRQELAKKVETETGWYQSLGYYSTVEENMKAAVGLDVATAAKRILESDDAESGGLDGLKKVAIYNAMRYAHFGRHSTSAVSNLLEEMKAAWWAEIVDACGGV